MRKQHVGRIIHAYFPNGSEITVQDGMKTIYFYLKKTFRVLCVCVMYVCVFIVSVTTGTGFCEFFRSQLTNFFFHGFFYEVFSLHVIGSR